MIRRRRLSEIGLRDRRPGGVLAGGADRDMATAGSPSRSWGEQECARQGQGNRANQTDPPGVVERRHRVVVTLCGHGGSSRSPEGAAN